MIKHILSEELEGRIDEWWDGYSGIFPANERFNKQEFTRFLGDPSPDYFNQIQIAEHEGRIEGVQMSKVFPGDGFMLGLYIWTTSKLRGTGVGKEFHRFSKQYALDQNLLFTSEVDMDADMKWFTKQGIMQLPVTYYQPPVGDSTEWVPMRLMIDIDTAPAVLDRSKIIGMITSIYTGVYHEQESDYAKYLDSNRVGQVQIPRREI